MLAYIFYFILIHSHYKLYISNGIMTSINNLLIIVILKWELCKLENRKKVEKKTKVN
jgi:hypothetical protein